MGSAKFRSDGSAVVAGCRGGQLAVWEVGAPKPPSRAAVHTLGLSTSICAVATSPDTPEKVSAPFHSAWVNNLAPIRKP